MRKKGGNDLNVGKYINGQTKKLHEDYLPKASKQPDFLKQT